MKKLMLVVAVLAIGSSALARHCNDNRSCRKSCANAFVDANCVQEVPRCQVPCLYYKDVPAIRHISYTCPSSCLTTEQVAGHTERIRTMHTDAGIEVSVEEVK